MVDLSIIIPAKNEEESIKILYHEIIKYSKNFTDNYEIIFIDDGSTDKTYQLLTDLHKKNPRIKVIKLRGNCGKSTALAAGFEHASGQIIITLDADLQDNPIEIPKFISKINEGYDLVSGWKKIRKDPLSKVIPSKIFNYLLSKLSGINIHDVNCGFKAYRKEVINNLSIYGELYRFIPIIAAKQNYKITEIEVSHRQRKFGKSKYGIERFSKGFLDLITIIFLTNYLQRPGHFFGTFGLISFFFGFLIGLYITYLRITTGTIQYRQPLLFLGMLLMIIGVQLVSTGLLAEMLASFNQTENTKNKIEESIL